MRGQTEPNLKRDLANMYLLYFQAKVPEYEKKKSYAKWSYGHVAGQIGELAVPAPWPGAAFRAGAHWSRCWGRPSSCR